MARSICVLCCMCVVACDPAATTDTGNRGAADGGRAVDGFLLTDTALAEAAVDADKADGSTLPDVDVADTITAPDTFVPDTSVADAFAALADATLPLEAGTTTVVDVTSATELQVALDNAVPGSVINLASGTYAGQFHIERSGEEGRPVVVRGPADRSAVLDGQNSVAAWQGVITLESQHHIVVENLEIKNTGSERYGVLLSATQRDGGQGCHDIVLRNLHVHDVGEEIIKIQGSHTHDILVEDCIVHSNQNWSGIDVQGHWDRDVTYAGKPKRVVIRNNLIYDIGGSSVGAGIGNEFADNIQSYNNIILGCTMGLDIGCGNYNVIYNNLVTSYAHFNHLKQVGYSALDLSRYSAFSTSDISGFSHQKCWDGIALSGNYMSLVFDNEITDCGENKDIFLSYDHGPMHNELHGHGKNLIFRNYAHDNDNYWTVHEYAKQSGGISYDQLYFNNIFAGNSSSVDMRFEHSEGLLFFNNVMIDENITLQDFSTGATLKNNIFINAGHTISSDSTGSSVASNYASTETAIFTDFAAGNYRLDSTRGAACIDSAENLATLLDPIFADFQQLKDTEFAFYPDFAIPFNFYQDFEGNTHNASWDMGAYCLPQ